MQNKVLYHRTYYELESWHRKEIKEKGMDLGVTVWFVDLDAFDDNYIKQGKIIKHDIHLEGDVMLRVEWTTKREWKVSDDLWVSDEKKRQGVSIDKSDKLVFMSWCFHKREDAVKCAHQLIKRKINARESEIDYLKKKQNKIK